MHFFILAGSHRLEAESTKVASYIEAIFPKLLPEATSFVYDLRGNPLPLWDDAMWNADSDIYKTTSKIWDPIAVELGKADAIIVISPERHGMATPGVKNFFLYTDAGLLGNKPGLLVSVSAGRGGRYTIAELRMSGTKNNQLCYIPQHVIVDHVGKVLQDHELEAEEKADAYIRKRLQYSLCMLHEYAQALQTVRSSGIADFKKYGNGM